MKVDLKIIGIIHSPFKKRSQAPRQGKNEIIEIEIKKEFEKALTDIEGFSHLIVLYWLHKSDGYNLMVNSPWDTTPHGLFTTRTPNRPNPIGHSIVRLIKRKENKLIVKGLDAIEGTPVIDIKPYIKNLDSGDHIKSGWIEKTKI